MNYDRMPHKLNNKKVANPCYEYIIQNKQLLRKVREHRELLESILGYSHIMKNVPIGIIEIIRVTLEESE